MRATSIDSSVRTSRSCRGRGVRQRSSWPRKRLRWAGPSPRCIAHRLESRRSVSSSEVMTPQGSRCRAAASFGPERPCRQHTGGGGTTLRAAVGGEHVSRAGTPNGSSGKASSARPRPPPRVSAAPAPRPGQSIWQRRGGHAAFQPEQRACTAPAGCSCPRAVLDLERAGKRHRLGARQHAGVHRRRRAQAAQPLVSSSATSTAGRLPKRTGRQVVRASKRLPSWRSTRNWPGWVARDQLRSARATAAEAIVRYRGPR